MNVLLIGSDSSFLQAVIDKLNKEGHRIFLLTEESKKKKHNKVFETYSFSYDDMCVGEVFESIKPDVTLYMGAYDLNFNLREEKRKSVLYMSALTNLLMTYEAEGRGRFIYLSSEEAAYTDTYRRKILNMSEGMCHNYQQLKYSDIVVLRMEHVYSLPRDKREMNNICARMCMEAIDKGEITVRKDREVSLLYMSDAVEFIYRVMMAEEHKSNFYQVSTDEKITEQELADVIMDALGGEISVAEVAGASREDVTVSEEDESTGAAERQQFFEEFGVRVYRRTAEVAPQVAKHVNRHRRELSNLSSTKAPLFKRIRESNRDLIRTIIPFIENMICFIPFFMLNNRAVGSRYFANLDFYLLYVLLFAIVFGQKQAIFSSLLAVSGYCFRQMYQRTGFDVMLDYNTYVWIAQLLILGLVVGYMRDHLTSVEKERDNEVDYLSTQLDGITDINVSNIRVKERLSDQLLNQDDSLGKIYNITSRLDKEEPAEVLFAAAKVLAKLMRSKDVAVYTIANESYARLFSATSKQARSLGNSICYKEMTALYEKISEGEVYINKNMDEKYPNMADAIFSNGEMQLIIMVWGLSWDRMTLGQANMLKIAGYLIQNSVVRANQYMAALEGQRYIEGTRIMNEEAFSTLVKAYLNAKSKNLTECVLLVSNDEDCLSDEEYSRDVEKLIRNTDYLGRLEDKRRYVLLVNTSVDDVGIVLKRFEDAGLDFEVQEERGA